MIGYRVHHKFHRMSFLITRSCFFKEIEDDSDDEIDESFYNNSLLNSYKSIVEGIGGTEDYTTDNNHTAS